MLAQKLSICTKRVYCRLSSNLSLSSHSLFKPPFCKNGKQRFCRPHQRGHLCPPSHRGALLQQVRNPPVHHSLKHLLILCEQLQPPWFVLAIQNYMDSANLRIKASTRKCWYVPSEFAPRVRQDAKADSKV